MRKRRKIGSGKVSTSKLKRELDKQFSLFIRAKYAKQCYTCGGVGKTLQCGHFIPRSYLATRWLESNCRPQCVGCNIWGKGKLLDFEENLKNELGVEAVEHMKSLRKKIWKLDRKWYEQQIALYKTKLSEVAQSQP